MEIESLFVLECPMCHCVYVLSVEQYMEILVNPKKVALCSDECMELYFKIYLPSLN